MMMKCHIWTNSILTFFWTLSVYQILILNVESFNLKCPPQAHWKLRTKANCNSTLKYYCLYNNIEGKYVEGCNGPDWDRKGSKRIYAGDFTRGDCIQERFQPFKFWTNGTMSDCIYAKSICSENGQIVYIDDSGKDDRTCRCDYKRNFSFVKTPRHLCYCIPTEEDCSCYIKSCPENYTLSSDYNCIQSGYHEKPKCIDKKYYETVDNTNSVLIERNETWLSVPTSKLKFKWRDTTAATVLFIICVMHIIVAGGFFFAVLFHPMVRAQILQPLPRYIQVDKKEHRRLSDETDVAKTGIGGNVFTIDGSNTVSCESTVVDQTHAEITTDEVNFLRLIHLLFRVACPVVRMILNHEIQPNQLRKSLVKNKAKTEKQYRKKEKIINSYKWDLLYQNVKEKTVTSEDFDIRLMIDLLRTLAPNIKVGDLYPIRTDTSIGAMLSRINYITNEATESFEGNFSQMQFDKYWNESGQAILKLVSSHLVNIEDDTKMTQLIGRLLELNPVHIDYNKLCLFIDMSEKYPSMILQQIISEYCTFNKLVIEDVLREEKHDLFHKRIKAEPCCVCATEYSTYIKVILEKQWEALFEMKEGSSGSCLHSCTSEIKKCFERFVPKKIDTSDLSVSMPLILNIPSILKYVISRLGVSGFSNFLVQNQHTLYHSMEKRRCCKCKKEPIEKILISKKEWSKLYRKGDHVSCPTEDCCCHFSVINRIEYSLLDDTLLSKIFYVSGPISVLNKIRQDTFLYFLSWTVDQEPLRNTITELSQIIENKSFSNIEQHISSSKVSQLDETKTQEDDASDWVYKHFRHQKETTEPPLQILVRDKVGLSVKCAQIPKDFPLPLRTQKFTDITNDENNFLVVVYGLTKIVYPVIKNHFNIKCPDCVLEKIYKRIYDNDCNDSKKGENKGQKKRKYLTKKQREQLFSPKLEDSQKNDLKLMIFLLKQRPEDEGKKDDDFQLEVIDSTRREIVQSSSGILNETKFKDILERITKAVLHFGGVMYKEKLLKLHHIRNILE